MDYRQTILIAKAQGNEYDLLITLLEEDGIRVVRSDNTAEDIVYKSEKYSPAVIVLNCTLFSIDDLSAITSHFEGCCRRPAFFDLFTYECDIEKLEIIKDKYDFSGSILNNAYSIARHLSILCSYTPVETKKLKSMAKQELSEAMLKLGITPSRDGWYFISDCIMYVLFKRRRRISFNNIIYPYISNKRNVKEKNIERVMRSTISAAWKNADTDTKAEYLPGFSTNINKPTNSDFVFELADHVYKQFRTQFDNYYRENDY